MVPPSVRFFGSELRRARTERGATQKQLGEATRYSEQQVGAVERGERLASLDFCQRADEFLDTGGWFARMREQLLTVDTFPEWFRLWPGIEAQATALFSYMPLVMPGLLQTEEYARALLRDETRVAARIERQTILTRENPPEVVVLLDETVLRRLVGDAEVMYQQLLRLADAPVLVQVVPTGAETYLGVDGSFVLATFDGAEVGYVDTPARGFVIEDREVVSHLKRRWDALRGEALPRRQSRELILEMAETWKTT